MKLSKSLLLVIFAWFATASNFALASTIYNYTGNNFTVTNEGTADAIVYNDSISITGTVELFTALPVNAATIATVAPTEVISFSFEDGNQTLTQDSAGISATFEFTTNNIGEIINWDVFLHIPLPGSPVVWDKARTIHTQNDTSLIRDIGSIATVKSIAGPPINTFISATDSGEVLNAGVWAAEVNAVPLPAAVWLFGSGLMGLIATGRRRLG